MSSDEIHLPLNSLDYIPPHNYVRLVFPLPLKSGIRDEVVFDDLAEALHMTFAQEPWVSGKVFTCPPETPGWRRGQLEIRHRPYSLDESQRRPYQLRYHKLDTPWTYARFRDCGFPSGVFPEELLLLDAPMVGDVDGAGAEVFLAQANFLPGGLLLGLTTFHAATDGAGMLNITKIWAENFRELHNRRDSTQPITPSQATFTDQDRDRSIPDQIWEKEYSNRTYKTNLDHEDTWLRALVALGPDEPNPGKEQKLTPSRADGQSSPPQESRSMLNRVMFLSSRDLATLQEVCAAEPSPAGTPPISVNDAIHALLWRTQLRARAAAAAARSRELDATSVFEAPVDVRDAFGPGFPPAYAGNCWLLATASMPLAELLAPGTTLGRIAQVLRRGAARLDRRAIHDAYALLRAAGRDLSRVQGRFVDRLDSADFLVSNMIFFPMSEISFGDRYFGNGGTPQAVRVLHGQYAPHVRLGHVLPRNISHGGVEISVNLFDDEMVYLDADEEVNRYLVTIEP